MKKLVLALLLLTFAASPAWAAKKPAKAPAKTPPAHTAQTFASPAQKYLAEGDQLMAEKDFAKAYDAYTKAIEADPKNAEAYKMRAIASNNLYTFSLAYGTPDNSLIVPAIDDLTLALQHSPGDAMLLTIRANLYRLSRQYDLALADCAALTPKSPSSVLYLLEGLSYMGKNDYPAAIGSFAKSLDLDRGQSAQTYSFRGECYEKTGQDALAGADYDAALARDNSFYPAWQGKARIAEKQGDRQEALLSWQNYRKEAQRALTSRSLMLNERPVSQSDLSRADARISALSKDPATQMDAAAWLKQGDEYYQSRNYAKAAEAYNKVVGYGAADSAVYLKLGNSTSGERALSSYTKAIELDPKNTEAYFRRAAAYANRSYETAQPFGKKYSEKFSQLALNDYTKAIELDKSNVDNYLRRGDTYRDMGRYDLAIADYTKALTLKNSPYFYLLRAVSYQNSKQYAKAVEDYTAALALDPPTLKYDFYSGRADSYKALGQYDKALADYTTAIGTAPDSSQPYPQRAALYAKMKKSTRAEADFDTYLQKGGYANGRLLTRANFYEEHGQYKEALADYDRTIQNTPQGAHLYYERGQFLERRKQYAKALDDYSQALRLQTDCYPALIAKARMANKLGRRGEAVVAYETYLAANPPLTQAELAEINTRLTQLGKTKK